MTRETDRPDLTALACPVPAPTYDRVILGHGSGGRLSAELLADVFLPAFGNPTLSALEDQATLALGGASRIAMTTDAFVVQPLFFPGGDIGKLAVHGTVNDLVVGGARPLALSAAFILEEGLPIDVLQRVVVSMRDAAKGANVSIVTGDTKVVERGKGDGIFVVTTGIGVVPDGLSLSVSHARPGDRVLVSGTLGDHGLAILSVRKGLSFQTTLESDTAPLTGLVDAILTLEPRPVVRCMRDPTRGGLASAVNEIAEGSKVNVTLEADALPFRAEVKEACEILGLDPLYSACEGRLVAIVAPDDAARVLAAMKAHPLGRDATDVGEVRALAAMERKGSVLLRSSLGRERLLAKLAGEALPRIC